MALHKVAKRTINPRDVTDARRRGDLDRAIPTYTLIGMTLGTSGYS
jgi:hypothetical protein